MTDNEEIITTALNDAIDKLTAENKDLWALVKRLACIVLIWAMCKAAARIFPKR